MVRCDDCWCQLDPESVTEDEAAREWNTRSPSNANSADKERSGGRRPSPCCVFEAQISVTDGGEPIDLFEDEDGGEVWRGDEPVGIGNDLQAAWNDYLYTCGADMQAPVNDEDLAEMWRQYDSHNATVLATANNNSDTMKTPPLESLPKLAPDGRNISRRSRLTSVWPTFTGPPDNSATGS